LTELLKQPQYSPMPVEEQVVTVFAGVRGYLDKIEVGDITRFEEALLGAIRSKHGDILETIRNEQALSEETEAKLASAVESVVKAFA